MQMSYCPPKQPLLAVKFNFHNNHFLLRMALKPKYYINFVRETAIDKIVYRLCICVEKCRKPRFLQKTLLASVLCLMIHWESTGQTSYIQHDKNSTNSDSSHSNQTIFSPPASIWSQRYDLEIQDGCKSCIPKFLHVKKNTHTYFGSIWRTGM